MSHNFDKSNYTKLRLIGEGSYGKIYKAQNNTTGEIIALKEIECKNLRQANRAKDEPFKICEVPHPSIIECYGFYFHETKARSIKVGILMEYVPVPNLGEVLNERFRTRRFWPERDMQDILGNLVYTLSFMEKHGVAHRDLKPENLFWFEGTNNIKLADLGESKAIGDQDDLATIRGTPRYLSPKLAYARINKERSTRHNIYKSDVFSVGLIVLEMASLMNITDLNKIECNGPEKIKNRLKQLKSIYSPSFLNILDLMLRYDEKARPDFIDLESMFWPTSLETQTDGVPSTDMGATDTTGDDTDPSRSLSPNWKPHKNLSHHHNQNGEPATTEVSSNSFLIIAPTGKYKNNQLVPVKQGKRSRCNCTIF
mmetsp:Transcript_45324/g.52110  ORF Transcript_45324/g.52110 Transcript_45324/m.52110 type:complete len:369 (-) Transcript_45324:494-1600(-)